MDKISNLKNEIISILDQTDAMSEVLRRDIKKVPALRGRVIVTLFMKQVHELVYLLGKQERYLAQMLST